MPRGLTPTILTSLTILLAACAPAASPGQGSGTPAPARPAPVPSFLHTVRDDLARESGISPDEITLRMVQAVEWSDTCLGAAGPNEVCAEVITPGYRVVFSTPDGDVEFHTDRSGEVYRQIVRNDQPSPIPGQTAVVWERSGGFAGLCERLVIDTQGVYTLEDACRPGSTSTGAVPDDLWARLRGWLDEYRSFSWESIPPSGSADMFSTRLTFIGMGDVEATGTEQAEVAAFLTDLPGELEAKGLPAPASGSGIDGRVVAGPTCPVVTVENPCPDRPVQATVTVMDARGEIVARVETGADGTFRVALPPGQYTLEAEAQGLVRIPPRVEVKVESGQFVEVTLAYDTGIR